MEIFNLLCHPIVSGIARTGFQDVNQYPQLNLVFLQSVTVPECLLVFHDLNNSEEYWCTGSVSDVSIVSYKLRRKITTLAKLIDTIFMKPCSFSRIKCCFCVIILLRPSMCWLQLLWGILLTKVGKKSRTKVSAYSGGIQAHACGFHPTHDLPLWIACPKSLKLQH